MKKIGVPASVQKRVHRSLCKVTGHPVDTATGSVFTEAQDFAFDGPIQLRWDRLWFSSSSSTHLGELGHGWHHPFEVAAVEAREVVIVRLDDGRWIPFARPGEAGAFNSSEGLRLFPVLSEGENEPAQVAGYRLEARNGLSWQLEPGPVTGAGAEDPSLRGFVLTGLEDRCGNRIELERGHWGRLQLIRDSTGRRLELEHDAAGRIIAVWGPDPQTPQRRVALVRYVYDGAGDLVEVHDALGQVSRYAYRDHLLIAETDRAGMSYYFEWLGEGSEARCLRTWGEGGLYGRAFRYEERKTTWIDSRGGEHVIEIDEHNRVVREHDPLEQVANFEYGEHGLLVHHINFDGHETHYVYDELARLVTLTEPGGLTTRFTYDERDAMIEVEYPDGSKRLREYDERGCLVGELEPDGTRWTYEVDARGLPARDSCEQDEVLRYLWSERGELVGFEHARGTHLRELDALGELTAELHPDGTRVEYERDLLGRVLIERDSSGRRTRYGHDPEGRVIRIEDGLGGIQLIERDQAGRVRVRVDPEGRRTGYEWDTENNLLQIEDGRGRHHRFAYDGADRQRESLDPIGRRTRSEYDAAGRILRATEIGRGGRERWHSYEYDERGRLVGTERGDGLRRRFEWDELDRVVKVEEDDLIVEREYDRRGHLIREQIGDLELRAEYDGDELRARITPGQRRIELDYDEARDPRSLSVDGRELLHYEYDAGSRELLRTSKATVARRSYDGCGRLASQYLEAPGSDAEPSWGRDYDYDCCARTRASRDLRFGEERYEIGASGELWRAWADDASALELARDPTGHLAGTPGAEERAMSAEGVEAHGYIWRWDQDGRLVDKHSVDGSRRWRLCWNESSELASVEVHTHGQPRLTAKLRYDGFSRLVRKSVEYADGRRAETHWLWHDFALVSERTRRWPAPGPGGEVDEPVERLREFFVSEDLQPHAVFEPDGRTLLLECDQIGAPRAAHDEQGELSWLADLDAHGRLRSVAVGERDRVPFRFLGQIEDPDLGIYYNIKRWYDPDLGAYLSPDPIGIAGGLHAWNFVDHPFDLVDPFGLEGTHWVYGLFDPSPSELGQKPYYVGITDRDLEIRAKEHKGTGRVAETAGIEALDADKVSETTARGYEQAYMDEYDTNKAKSGSAWGTAEKPLKGNARGNRQKSYINNKSRKPARYKAFEDARKAKRNLLKGCT